jgi:hypothetical protein
MGLMDSLKDKFNETGLTEQLCGHINGCGLKARVVDKKGPEGLPHSNKIIGIAPLGCIRLEGCNFDYVEVYRFMEQKKGGFSVGIGDMSFGNPKDNIAYEYTAAARFEVGDSEKDLRAEIDHVTKGLVKKEVVDFSWKGGALAQKLNQDAQLRSMLQALGMPWIEVSASKKDDYVEVGQGHARGGTFALTTGKYDFPSSQMLAVYDRIFGVVGTMRTRIVK